MGAGASTETQDVALHPQLAAQKKEQGNEYFSNDEYAEAVLSYSEAISLVNLEENAIRNSPSTVAVLWSNRSAARFKCGSTGEALSDALVAISLHPRWYKPYWRAGQAAAQLEQWQLAREYLVRAQVLTNNADSMINTLLEQARAHRPVGIQDGPGSLMTWGDVQEQPDRPKVVDELRGKFVTEVAAGAMHTLAVTPHGLYSWGSNEQGQCGIGVSEGSSTLEHPQLIPSLVGIKVSSISCGAGHSCAIDANGTLWTWGIGGQGQLGLGNLIRCVPTPTAVLSLREEKQRVRAVSCGIAHTFIVTTNIETDAKLLMGFGWNNAGQLGLGQDLSSSMDQLTSSTFQAPRATDTVASPTKIKIPLKNTDGDEVVQQVACGGAHTVVVTRDGRVFTTGSGSCGQLGLGQDANQLNQNGGAVSSFTEVDSTHFGGKRVAFAAAGEEFTCFVTCGDQEVWACGLGNAGQLGDGKSNNCSAPRLVAGMTGKQTVSLVSGKASTMACTSDGQIYVWGGKNPPYEPQEEEWRTPQLLIGIRKKRVRQLEIGRSHYCALLFATSPEFSHVTFKKSQRKEQELSLFVIQLGKKLKFGVQAVDDGGNNVEAGCDQFHISAVEESSGGTHFEEAIFDDNFDGSYHCSVKPKTTGTFSVQIKLHGVHIVGSPFRLEVKDDEGNKKKQEEEKQKQKQADKLLKQEQSMDLLRQKKRKELMAQLKRQEMTRRRAKEAGQRAQRERKADEDRERRRKKQRRCGGGFVVSFDSDDVDKIAGSQRKQEKHNKDKKNGSTGEEGTAWIETKKKELESQ